MKKKHRRKQKDVMQSCLEVANIKIAISMVLGNKRGVVKVGNLQVWWNYGRPQPKPALF